MPHGCVPPLPIALGVWGGGVTASPELGSWGESRRHAGEGWRCLALSSQILRAGGSGALSPSPIRGSCPWVRSICIFIQMQTLHPGNSQL